MRLLICCLIKGPLFFRLLLFQRHGRSPGRGQRVNSRQLRLHLFFFPSTGPHTKAQFHLQPSLGLPIVWPHLNWLCLEGGLWLVEEGVVDWVVLYLVSKGATLCVQSVCIPRKVGDSTAQRRLFSASQPACVYRSGWLSRSLSLSLALALFLSLSPCPSHSAQSSALLHSTPRGPALCLPCQLNGVCQVCQYDWFLWFCQLSPVKLTWRFNLTGRKRIGFLLPPAVDDLCKGFSLS